ncbi:MAG TPA: short chain dehydrogenase [Opitutae bacterium]|nr:short-chain dehydrogenase [Opitutaceae bacterium]HCR29530.1 short chain dehydrogenase [Opitutae bacterium]|tara:strand:- start:15 stop:806 length:792 start_codon:yes stop_codon:yes gene_type:complete
MDLQVEGKVAIVTGGNKGIGEGISRAFAEEGAIVVVFGRNRDEGEAFVGDLSRERGKASFRFVEMTDEENVKIAVASVLEEFGRIDIIVNNAGVNDGVGLDAGLEAFRESLERNLTQCYSLVHHSLEALKASHGCIVNIGSKVAETGQGGTSGYAASKGGINGLTREWALDLAGDGIRVNCVIPAEVMTPLYERWISTQPDPEESLEAIRQSIPLKRRMTTIQEIADTVVFVASPRSSHTTGQILYVDGGYTHFDRRCTIEQE